MKEEVILINGDCMEAMHELINQGVQVDSIVTDPPYELGFMGKEWDKSGIGYKKELWELCLKILKPGGHLLSFGGARTYHRMTCAIEDAGFEVRDQIMWIYGQGFPKSLDVSKAIDKMAGAEREVVGLNKYADKGRTSGIATNSLGAYSSSETDFITAPSTEAAKQWQGFGSALKPAHEPIVLARKPLSEKTIVANVLKHGTGAINVDGCRVGNEERLNKGVPSYHGATGTFSAQGEMPTRSDKIAVGRFPANLIHDGSDEVEEEFKKQSEAMGMHSSGRSGKHLAGGNTFGGSKMPEDLKGTWFNDKGTASRFFYCAKASKKDRNGSKHPTVKPIALMRYLCRLITPPGGLILDPFAGSGTTGQAAIEEGFKAILIEKEIEYFLDIKTRLSI
jgi:DNA modification methylase